MRYRSRPFELEAEEFQPGPGPDPQAQIAWRPPDILVGGYRVAYKWGGGTPAWELWCEASKTWCRIAPGDYIALEPPREPGADPVGHYPIQKHVFLPRWERAEPLTASEIAAEIRQRHQPNRLEILAERAHAAYFGGPWSGVSDVEKELWRDVVRAVFMVAA